MALMDRPIAEDDLLLYERQENAPAQSPGAGIAEPQSDDPLAPARGTVYGVALGAILWILILWAIL